MPSGRFVLNCDAKRINVSRWRNLQDDLHLSLRDGRDAFVIIDDRAIDAITVHLIVVSQARITRVKEAINHHLTKHMMQGDVTIALSVDDS